MKYDSGMTYLHGDVLAAVRLMLYHNTEITKKFSSTDGSPVPLREYLKDKYKLSGKSSDKSQYFCRAAGMGINLKRPLNNEGDRELQLSWSQLAVFIRNNWDEVFKKEVDTVVTESVPSTVEEIQTAFDYTLVTTAEADKLRECETAIRQETAGYFTKLGEKFKEAQELLADHHEGFFEEWYKSLGFKRQTVYNLIQRYDFLSSPTVGEQGQDVIESLPLTLTYEISRPNAPKELVARVLDGDITTNAEYQKLKKAYDTAAMKLDEVNRDNIRVAKQREELYDKCAALEAQTAAKDDTITALEKTKEQLNERISKLEGEIKELENRPVETAVQYVEKIPDDYITRDAYENMVNSYIEQLDKSNDEYLAEKRRAFAEKTELEKKLAEVEEQLKAAKAEAENAPADVDGVYKAYVKNAYSSLNVLVEYVQEHKEYIPKVTKLIDDIKNSLEA